VYIRMYITNNSHNRRPNINISEVIFQNDFPAEVLCGGVGSFFAHFNFFPFPGRPFRLNVQLVSHIRLSRTGTGEQWAQTSPFSCVMHSTVANESAMTKKNDNPNGVKFPPNDQPLKADIRIICEQRTVVAIYINIK
jgi:hypothetical protein